MNRDKAGVVPTIRSLSEAIKAKDNLLVHFRKRLGLLGEQGDQGSPFKAKNQPAGADTLGAVPLPTNDGFGEEPGAGASKDALGGDIGDTYFSPAGKNVHTQSAVTKRDLRMAEDEI